MKPSSTSLAAIAEVLLDALRSGAKVDIDGLGSFIPDENGNIRFVDRSLPKVFIAYVHEDCEAAERVFDAARVRGSEILTERWSRSTSQLAALSESTG